MQGLLRDLKVVTSAPASMDALAQMIGEATHEVRAALFGLDDQTVVRAFRREVREGTDVWVHRDSEMLAMGDYRDLAKGKPDNLRLTESGDVPLKMHAKAATADDQAWVSTAAALEQLREERTFDIAARFSGAPALALQELIEALSSGTVARVQSAAGAAATHGIVTNAPQHGVFELRDGLVAMIRAARSHIYVASKVVDDPMLARELALAQAQHGVRILVDTSHLSSKDGIKVFTKAGLRVKQLPDAKGRMHANVMIVDGTQMYAGTGMFTRRGVGDQAAFRRSVELGFITDDRTAINEVVDALRKLKGGRAHKLFGRSGPVEPAPALSAPAATSARLASQSIRD